MTYLSALKELLRKQIEAKATDYDINYTKECITREEKK